MAALVDYPPGPDGLFPAWLAVKRAILGVPDRKVNRPFQHRVRVEPRRGERS
jgi:hypothetical protein